MSSRISLSGPLINAMNSPIKPAVVNKTQTTFMEVFGLSRAFALSVVIFSGAAVAFAIFWCVHSARPAA